MRDAADNRGPFHPPAPTPRSAPPGRVAMIYALWRNPLEIWSRFHYERPIVVGDTPIGPRAVVCDPLAIRRVFLDNAQNYVKDPLQLSVLRPGLGSGLLTAEGDDWRRQRRALAPLFAPRQLAAFAPAMHEVAARFAESLIGAQGPRLLNVGAAMARATLLTLERTLFTQGLARDPGEFQRAVTRYFETFGRLDPLDLMGAPAFLPRLARMRGRSALIFFDRAVDDIIAARRRLIASGAAPPFDILTLLMRAADPETGAPISEADVRANIITFIGAGHETTANALTWTLYLLSQSPDWLERVEAEIDDNFDLASLDDPTPRLPVTLAALEEALRLYPPVAFMSRQAVGEDRLGGHVVPAGTIVIAPPFIIHRHRTLWRDPDLYDPTRFLGKAREAIDRFAFVPFGVGPRICIGMGFAMQEAVIVLAHCLKRLRFRLAPGARVKPVQRVTLRPEGGMPMIVRGR